MNIYLKQFLQRGIAFAGFGPIIAGVVYFIISLSVPNFSLNGAEVLIGIISTYFLAFIHAGVSVFNQIESWPLAKSLLCHMGSLYLSYIFCYLVNSWIAFEPVVILIFTAIFAVSYFVIWFIVLVCIKATSKKFNEKLNKKSV